jgi:hypothetical protein
MQEKRMNQLKSGASDQLKKKSGTDMKQGSTPAAKKPQTNFLTGCLGCFGLLVAIAFVAIVVMAIFQESNEPKEKKTSSQTPAVESPATNGVAEIGAIERFASAEKLARFAGIAPVRHGTGGKDRRYKSKQGNRVLHDLFRQLAIRQLVVAKKTKQPRNPYFLQYNEQKLREGKSKRQAIVCLMRKLVNVVYYLLKYKATYQMPDIPQQKAGWYTKF